MNTRFIPSAQNDYEGVAIDAAPRNGRRRRRPGPSHLGAEPDPNAASVGLDLQETYGWMTGLSPGQAADQFDVHAFASIFTRALADTDWGRKTPLAQALGLGFDEAVATVVTYFPHALVEIGPVLGHGPIERSEKEARLLDLLWRGVPDPGELRGRFAKILARRAQRPNALWRALGLRNRGELSTLMSRHFPELALRNASDIRWKAHLYRHLARGAGDTLCATPSCLECDDFFRCFGEESSVSLPITACRGTGLKPRPTRSTRL